jgi:PAS domain S-box-containing protein
MATHPDAASPPHRATADPIGTSLPTAADIFLRGGGEMAALTRGIDWAATPLGAVATWSASLRTTVSTLLASRHAMFLWWGPELIQFYNDGYRPSLGPDRHPSALGARGRECWAEIWPIIGPEIDAILAGGEATWHEDHLVPITRGDRVDDVYWSYSYSPVLDDDGSVGGVLVTVQETTRRVVEQRRVRLLQELAAGMLHARSAEDISTAAAASFRSAPDDVGFALLYLADGGGGLRLAASTGVEPDSPVAPTELRRPEGESAGRPWQGIPPVACGRWPEPVSEAAVLPLEAAQGSGQPHGVVILGLNPRLPLDAEADRFVAQVAHEIAVALDGVRRLAQERATAQAAANAERALLTDAFRLAPSFMAVLRGPGHVFELVNPAYERLVGYRDVVGRTLLGALPELEGQGFIERLDRVYATGEPFVGNEVPVSLQPVPVPGGPAEQRYLNFVYQAMRGPGGEVSGILVTGVDVTALVEARQIVERALAETERIAAERDAEGRQLRTVLEQAPLAIAITGPAGEIRFANRTFERLWGRAPEDTSAAAYSEVYDGYHLDGRPIASEEWAGARAVLHGEVVEGEVIQIVQRGGPEGSRRLTVWISAAPVRDGEGRITGGVVMFRDITAERRTEHQLRDAQRLQAVGTLAGGVAHEVNNALQGALGFGSFVLRALGPEHPQAADMRLVLQSAERAARVSQQLLAYARRQMTQPQPVDLVALTAHVRPVLQQLLGADKALVLAPVAADVPPIQADPAQVEQVLINLVANARDATETGDQVTIAVQRAALPSAEEPAAEPEFRPEPGLYVRLSVSDTGHGMSPQTLARVFDPFFTTKAVGKGTGLGLSMVYGTVKQHGGYILARSAAGAGTTMDLYWPAAVGFSASASGAGEGDARPGLAGAGRLVLVADDEPLVRALVVRTLEEEGYAVVAAGDGEAALEVVERGRLTPDVVVTDVIMPRRNGRQLHDALVGRWPDLPVLFTSGHTGEEAVLQRLVPPGAPFLQKPFTPEALAGAVNDLAQRARAP